jgi:hypothetical protein
MSDLKSFLDRWSRRKRAATEDASPPAPALPFAQTRSTSPCKGEIGEQSEPGGGQRQRSQASNDPHPTTLPSLREAKLVDLPLAGGGITESASTECPSTGIAFDVTRLPPIESITAESDIRAFLAPGIPPELTRAALRRAWAVDPKIREFVGLSENSWDFNAPGAIPGFGPLEMTDELRRQIVQFVGRNVASETADASASIEGQEEHATVETSAISNAGDGDATRQSPISHAEPVKSGAQLPHQLPQRDNVHIPTQGEPERPNHAESRAKGLHGRALPK